MFNWNTIAVPSPPPQWVSLDYSEAGMTDRHEWVRMRRVGLTAHKITTLSKPTTSRPNQAQNVQIWRQKSQWPSCIKIARAISLQLSDKVYFRVGSRFWGGGGSSSCWVPKRGLNLTNPRNIVILFGDNFFLLQMLNDIQGSLKGITLSRRLVKHLSSSSRLGAETGLGGGWVPSPVVALKSTYCPIQDIVESQFTEPVADNNVVNVAITLLWSFSATYNT